jgi:cell division protease FtsH
LLNEAALLAARFNKKIIGEHELEEAKDKVMMGPQRKSLILTDEDKRKTAYHEGGHALVALHLPASDQIHKATIIPRGRALGLVMRLPESEISKSRDKFEADVAVAMGGRVAEEIILGHAKVTSGASSDIKMATAYARSMVREWGMSDKVGPLYYGTESHDAYVPQNLSQKLYSVHTEDLIDKEVRAIVDKGYTTAKRIIEKHLDQLHMIAKGLLEKETLTGDDLKEMLFGTKRPTTAASQAVEKKSLKKRAVQPKKPVKPKKK